MSGAWALLAFFKTYRQIAIMRTCVFICTAFLLTSFFASARGYPERPRLVVMIVVDQLRADYLTKFSKHFLPAGSTKKPGGYRFLMEKGAYFPMAEYPLLQNMTCPGHATLSTGALPYQHGIPLNGWFQEGDSKRRYCVGDPNHPIVGAQTESQGISPKNLIGTTLGDQIKFHAPESRVFSVSIKDRSAVLLGGHQADLALWFDWRNHAWVSSKYYLPDAVLPTWVVKLNESLKKSKQTDYLWRAQDKKSFTRTYTKSDRSILQTPYGIEITTQAALEALRSQKLGHGKGIDVLAISYSSHDYAGHEFGPDSEELRQMTIAEDRTLSLLLSEIERQVPGGLQKTIITLTADHGVSPATATLAQARVEHGRVNTKNLFTDLNSKLTERFGAAKAGESWIVHQTEFNFFLNHPAILSAKKSRQEFEAVLKAELMKAPGTAFVVTRSEIERRELPPLQIGRSIEAQYFHSRSGDVILIPKPYYSADSDVVVHMTHYSYDRQVPLLLYGAPFKGGVCHAEAQAQDLAPTLSFVLGVLAPPASEGRVLYPALRSR
jgi:predicted AlkP superfamily pyrophosphatase or phosphodiesterase